MIIKVFKAVWFLSLVATLAIFLYIYASLPADIQLGENSSVTRDTLFYATLGILSVFNALVFAFSKLYNSQAGFFRVWFYGLMTFFNLFLIVSLQFINVYNSQEKYNYDSLGFVIYGSLGMVVLWSSLWPFYSISQRILNKEGI